MCAACGDLLFQAKRHVGVFIKFVLWQCDRVCVCVCCVCACMCVCVCVCVDVCACMDGEREESMHR